MRAIILFFCFLLLLSYNSKAQSKDSILFRMVVHFNSICCGVPDKKPLIDVINSFKKTYHKRSINATYIGPMGREGEYMLAFTLGNLSSREKKQFIKKVKLAILKMNDKGNATLTEYETIIKSSLPKNVIFDKRWF